MFTTEKTAKALAFRFECNDWEPIILNIRATKDRVRITPCWNNVPRTAKDCEMFLIDCEAFYYAATVDTIEQVAQILNTFDSVKAEHIRKQKELDEQYAQFTARRKTDKWDTMRAVQKALFSIQKEHPEINVGDFDAMLTEHLQLIQGKTGFTREQIEESLSMTQMLEEYSDQYISLYAKRPPLF